MTFTGTQALFKALNAADVRYLVVGGLAVVAHGFVRLTVDTDLVIQLEETNLCRALAALEDLGYQPRVPVAMSEFADARARDRWVQEKGMVVFQLTSRRFPANNIDMFAESPFDFDEEYGKAVRFQLDESTDVPVVALTTLIDMKRSAGRTKDLLDVENLENVQREEHGDAS